MGVIVITTMGLLLFGLIYSSVTGGEIDVLRRRLHEDSDEDIYSSDDSVSNQCNRVVLFTCCSK